jgi:beta-glucosidase
MEWDSSSNKEFRIDQGATPEDQTLLRRTYLPPFAEGVQAGALSVMAGLNSWGDTKLAASQYLLTSILKQELDFEGFVVSDWYGVYEIPGGDYKAAITAINAGVDMVMLPFDYKTFINNVHRAVLNGEIEESRIDDAVRRILKVKFALGLFDPQSRPLHPLEIIGSQEHRAVAREAVAASLVLLKNEDVLPIAGDIEHIRIAGSAADNVGRQSGAWTVEWQGIDGNWLQGATSILQGITHRAGEETVIEYELGGNFSTSSEEVADLGIAIVGEPPYAEGWGDSENPTLSFDDLQTIERLKQSCDKVLVVIVSGRPLLITDDIASWDALVAAWLPGSEGEGAADVLFGDVPFKGRLPLPWPAYLEQLPIAPDGTTADRTPPLFPRGFGL